MQRHWFHLTFLITIFLTQSIASYAGKNLILDHDGGVDDFSALLVLYGSKKFDLKAVTIQPADCYNEHTVPATQSFLDTIGAKNVRIATSDLEGTHPFPHVWRMHGSEIQKLLPPSGSHSPNPVLQQRASDVLIELLSGTEPYTLVLTGPLSNLAEALAKKPSIKNNIERAYIMGGAVRVPGNIDEFPEAGEWNFYNNPPAAAQVLRSGIPITLVGLDATQFVPVRDPLVPGHLPLVQLLKERVSAPLSQLAFQAWSTIQPAIDDGTYYFWDTLTAAVAVEPQILKTEKMRIQVLTNIPYEGRTQEVADPSFPELDVGVGVNKNLLENVLLQSLDQFGNHL